MTYIELINSIKNQYNKDWLTPSQFEIYEKLTTKFKVQKMINIFGDRGVGKTFLGWILANYFKGYYTTNKDEIEANQINILDNYSFKKKDIRMLLPLLQSKSIPKLFVITDKQVRDDITSIELKFDSKDKIKFKNNLWKYCQFEFAKEKDDMHSLIKVNIS